MVPQTAGSNEAKNVRRKKERKKERGNWTVTLRKSDRRVQCCKTDQWARRECAGPEGEDDLSRVNG